MAAVKGEPVVVSGDATAFHWDASTSVTLPVALPRSCSPTG